MTSIIASIKDLISSIFEVIFSTAKTAFDTVFSVFHLLFTSVVSIFGQIFDTFKGALGATAGVGKFVASNIFVLAFIGIGTYVYLNKKSRQGRPVTVGNKKLN